MNLEKQPHFFVFDENEVGFGKDFAKKIFAKCKGVSGR